MSLLPELERPGYWYLILDGAKVSDAGQMIYSSFDNDSPECEPLYNATALDAVREVSPWIIKVNAGSLLLSTCFTSRWSEGLGVLFRSPYELRVVADHFRGLVMAKHHSGEEVIFRFYDPTVLIHLMDECSDGDKSRLLGPCDRVAAPVIRNECWAYFDHADPAPELFDEPFVITPGHFEAMERAAYSTALIRLKSHTETHFPELLGSDKREVEGRWQRLEELTERASRMGLSGTRDLALYLNTLGYLGEAAFDESDIRDTWETEKKECISRAICLVAEKAEQLSREGLSHG